MEVEIRGAEPERKTKMTWHMRGMTSIQLATAVEKSGKDHRQMRRDRDRTGSGGSETVQLQHRYGLSSHLQHSLKFIQVGGAVSREITSHAHMCEPRIASRGSTCQLSNYD